MATCEARASSLHAGLEETSWLPSPTLPGTMLTPGGGVPTLKSPLCGWGWSVWDAWKKEAFLCRAVIGWGEE